VDRTGTVIHEQLNLQLFQRVLPPPPDPHATPLPLAPGR
jgi:hypothetical protein